jgi:RNA polymerase sigma factor (sigma-70 family)
MIGDLPVVENKASARVTPRRRAGVPPGFDEFFRSAYHAFLGTAIFVGARGQKAEDAVAAAMEEVWRRWGEVDEPLAYGRRATVSNFLKEKERGLARVRRRMAERREVMQETAGIDALSVWEDRQWVTQLLQALPLAQREVMACIVDGFKPAEIAILLGKTPEAVRQNLHAARERLRLTLLDQDEQARRSNRSSSSPRKEARSER